MPSPLDLTGAASAAVASIVLRRLASTERVPAAQLQVLLSVHLVEQSQQYGLLTTAQLGQMQLMSLPLLRGYIRQLEAGGYVRRESFFRRGPRLLQLTSEGRGLARRCAAHIKRAAHSFLDGEPLRTFR